MLVLSRKLGERILIGDNVAITLVRLGSGNARIGIEAPQDVKVVREEVASQDHPLVRRPPSAPAAAPVT